jgi:hypothetical protein
MLDPSSTPSYNASVARHPQNAGRLPALQSELLSFPDGRHDDQVDALGLIGQLLDTILVSKKPAPAATSKIDTGCSPVREAVQPNDWLVS